DYLAAEGGRLASLSHETRARLADVLPATWSGANPVDIIGDAGGERYAAALAALLADREVEGVLVLHVPVALVSPTEAARSVIQAVRASGSRRPVLTSWMGGDAVADAREAFHEAEIPTYATPERAVQAFLHLVRYRRNQELLMETPAPLEDGAPVDADAARRALAAARAEGREWLTEPEAKRVLATYRIPIVESEMARSPDEAAERAGALGYPVAVKILSPDLTHKSDVGGVALDLESPAAVREAARTMTDRLAELRPSARLEGFVVQRMARRPAAHELIVGAATDPVFGPVILFGHGGTAVEVIADRAVSLPPLNEPLARSLVRRTRVAKLLEGYRDRPPARLDEILRALVRVSQLVLDHPRILELDINPLLADDQGVLALDARIRIDLSEAGQRPRPAIRPYPKHLEERVRLGDGREVLLRPIRPEDEPAHRAFHDSLSDEDIRFRHFGLVREFSHTALARYTQIDYDREMAFIATERSRGEALDGGPTTLGVVRGISDPDHTRAEFAIIVRSSVKGIGLGRALLEKLVRYCRERGMREIVGHVLPDNAAMLGLAESLGFRARSDPESGVVVVRRVLDEAAAPRLSPPVRDR
ncbi:MAG: GNAT family N-acetyltransferase, partial [Gemmatimonadota bacterium]